VIHILNHDDPESAVVHDSSALTVYVKFIFDASYTAKYTTNNLKLVQFTFSHAIKADKKWN